MILFELLKVTFDVTNACNLRCKHCLSDSSTSKGNELNLEEIKRFFLELYDLGTFELLMSGRGEPFARSDFNEILNMANKNDFSLAILTNGTLLDKNKVHNLSDLSIRQIQIPLEGLKDSHEFLRGLGTYDPALNAINMIKDEGIKVQVRTTVTRNSLFDLEHLADLLENLNVDTFFITEFIPVGRGYNHKELMLRKNERTLFQNIFSKIKQKHNNRMQIKGGPYGCFSSESFPQEIKEFNRSVLCGALRGDWCEVLPNGDVTPCDLIQFYAGNIRLNSMGEIWNSSRVFKAFRNFDPANLKGACGECEHQILCGGCRALAFLFNGDFFEEDPACWCAKDDFLSV